jgi:hypothetical protein
MDPLLLGAVIGVAYIVSQKGFAEGGGAAASGSSAGGSELGQEPVAAQAGDTVVNVGGTPQQYDDERGNPVTVGNDGAGPVVVGETGGPDKHPTDSSTKPGCACVKAPCDCAGHSAPPPVASSPPPRSIEEVNPTPAPPPSSGGTLTRSPTPIRMPRPGRQPQPGRQGPPILVPRQRTYGITRKDSARELSILGPRSGAVW